MRNWFFNKLISYRDTPWYIPINHWTLFWIEMLFELVIIGFITLWPSNERFNRTLRVKLVRATTILKHGINLTGLASVGRAAGVPVFILS